ncbi:MAG: MFS transporter [Clostridia bacterium]|nr:MFS transporter [Clostridia bacterium]
MNLAQTVKEGVDKVRTHWKTPMKGRYMPFREIAAYSGGGIGAYMIITMGSACLLSANNTFLSGVLGVAPMDMYVMYVISVIANIFLTGVRANIIDNTRNKAGKYRPYIVKMAIPAAIITNTMVWFPYDKLGVWFGDGTFLGHEKAYIAKCAIIMVLNLFLNFFYYFFYDAYENLIHVLSPNSVERSDVASVKSVVYSFAPTVINFITPLISEHVFHSNQTDIRVYRLVYPILAVGGILLCTIVYKYTEEKIVQARTHVVQIKFVDALRAVAKNKYFWIISLAGWIGFLESAYSNIMYWLYNYGGACSGTTYSLITTLYGNASLWGMLAAPFCIRKWGKKAVLVITNFFNIIFILAMLLFTEEITYNVTILLVMSCLWLNALMGSFAHILNPAIQADIRDYQQYITGERIDGMFSVVTTIGTILSLATSSVLPFIYEQRGITVENAKLVTSRPEILNRIFDPKEGITVGDILAKQLAEGQDNYANPNSALYDPEILMSLVNVLIIIAAFGALMNVIPFFWYDFNERKQTSIVRVLKVRALFEDYGNGITNDQQLVEGIDIIRNARAMAGETPKTVNKKDYKSIKDKAERKAAKKAYKEALEFNEEIEISKFVCDELDKFSTDTFKYQYNVQKGIYEAGLESLKLMNLDEINSEMAAAKAMPKSTKEEKDIRKFAVELARNKKSAFKALNKYFADEQLVKPDYAELEKLFDVEDACDDKLKALYLELKDAKKAKDSAKVKSLKAEIKSYETKKAEARKASKVEMDRHAYFARAAKPYLDAEKLVKQEENYKHLDDIAEMYDDAKARYEAELAAQEAKTLKEKEEQAAYAAQLKAEKAAKKAAKKNK